jgi:hypothetical protein
VHGGTCLLSFPIFPLFLNLLLII